MIVFSLAVTDIVIFFIIFEAVCEAQESFEYGPLDPVAESINDDENKLIIRDTRIVQTANGFVEGYLKEGLYYEFCSIRYAVAKNRFIAPSAPPFKKLHRTDFRMLLCPQYYSTDPLSAASVTEECLILNIYVPLPNITSNVTIARTCRNKRTNSNVTDNTKTSATTKANIDENVEATTDSDTTLDDELLKFIQPTNMSLPVIVFLHGGDFGTGGSSPVFYNPKYLVQHGVVVVTVNYRLNAFGFLNLGIKEAPGNAGLKDIRAALRWVRDNIGNFEGDKDNVTVFGHGSGGVAAVYLTLSESCNGLFHRIICASGAPFASHSFDINPLDTASKFAESLGMNSSNPVELAALYQNVEVLKLVEELEKKMHSSSLFLPSVETYFDEEPFLTDTPYKILNSGAYNAVPAIIGLNTIEGFISILDAKTFNSQVRSISKNDLTCLDLRNFHVSEEEKVVIRNNLKTAYFSEGNTDQAIIGGLINLNSDFNFVGPITLLEDLYTNGADVDVYHYIFNYIGERNFGRIRTNLKLQATTHMDELFYIFELERMDLEMNENDTEMMLYMTKMWTNFAKYGNPTPDSEYKEWLAHPYQLELSLNPEYVYQLTRDRAYYWRELYFKYGAEIGREIQPEPENEAAGGIQNYIGKL